MARLLLLYLLITSFCYAISANLHPLQNLLPTQPPISVPPLLQDSEKITPRQIASYLSTCGYKNGDLSLPRTAEPGFDCRVDTANGIWGFCTTTVVVATDCWLAGYCVDSESCSDGCGRLKDRADIVTATWYGNRC
jgi:hypothetical protein